MGEERRATVAYAKSGSIMRAARLGQDAVIDNALYYWRGEDEDEAAYLVGLLNAPCLRVVFEAARATGRHFDLTPWERVPIPNSKARFRPTGRWSG